MKHLDLVIGAVTGYNFQQIAPWVNSLEQTGFSGAKAVVAYNMDATTVEELRKRGFMVIGFKQELNGDLRFPKPNFSIVVERFLHYYVCMNTPTNRNDIRYVVATDVKDVIFQRNPSEEFDAFRAFDVDIIASSEELEYSQEPWGANNMQQAYGRLFYLHHQNHTICNAGVIAGKFEAFLGLCKTIYLMSTGAPQFVPGGGGPDQAAYNLLLETPVYKKRTLVQNHNDQWAAQLGTTMDPSKISGFMPYIKSGLPTIDRTRGLVINPSGTPYAIVHQYDRVPEVKAIVERKYL